MTDLTRRSTLGVAAGAAALPLLAPMRAKASAPPVAKQVPGVYRYKVGDIEVTVVTDGGRTVPLPDTLVKNATKDQVNAALQAAFFEKDKFSFFFNPVVVNTGSKLVAIDSGNGPAAHEQSKGAVGQYHTNLAAAGIDAKAIDIVAISHFHADHIGGLVTADGKPAFPNAEVMVPVAEWAYWMDEGNMSRAPDPLKPGFQNVRRVFGALGDKVTQYESGKDIVPGIKSIATYGHTPGHTSHMITSGSQTVVVQGDVTNLPQLFARNPGWHASFDMDGAKAEETRRKLYDQLATDRMIVQGYHYTFPAAAHIEKDGNGYRPNPVAWQPVL
ncbi:MBL fold metallo-hydrolase [Bradyrhizobium sp. LHD-71]|uniref:MBL fold metallo-hydrolase n=1 Tax=Bradyrhizobium sp. LHD-71 TaxID=3072141 RepID=UPI00280DF0B0|nr:MBL fold metallo-hydrolase [Bradyrhizobium sp. LHD-71]MDQ8731541.1 MBL fold metallo-hydrolase [Bradyrhizobium sp. LHD-71]